MGIYGLGLEYSNNLLYSRLWEINFSLDTKTPQGYDSIEEAAQPKP